MADQVQLNLPQTNPAANMPAAPTNIPLPLQGLTQGIQSGAGLGLQAQQIAAEAAQRHAQTALFQQQAMAAQQKNLIDYMGVAHETYKDLAEVNPEHAFQFYAQKIAPAHQLFLQMNGIPADFSNVNSQDETPPIVEKINELMDKASNDPSKIPTVAVTLQQMANMPTTGKLMQQRIENSMKTLGTVTDSQKHMDQLEQDWSNQINVTKARSGGFGMQDQKVDQAIHLRQLLNQFHDQKTGDYNVPTSQYAELTLGLANLLSPTGTANENTIKEIQSLTGKSNLAKMVQYATGKPQTGNSQAIIKNLADSIDRQGQTSQQLRDQYLYQLQPPANLSADRAARIVAKGRGSNYADYLPQKSGQSSQDSSNQNTVTVQAPDGTTHVISKSNLAAAQKKYPGTRIVGQ